MVDSQIIISNLLKSYSSRAEELTVLRGVSFEVARGEVICLLGTSGSGKTTMLNLLAGIDKPTAGKIYYDGKDINEWTTDQLFEYRLKDIGFIFQEFYLLEHLNALENVMVPIILKGESEEIAQDIALQLLNQVD
ncbi:MAG: ABC transporter ATP-binding protein, partial [Candidatus Heimdallarchaeaceae archaeon]